MLWGQAVKNWGQLGGYLGGMAGRGAMAVGRGEYGATAAGALYGGVGGAGNFCLSQGTHVSAHLGIKYSCSFRSVN